MQQVEGENMNSGEQEKRETQVQSEIMVTGKIMNELKVSLEKLHDRLLPVLIEEETLESKQPATEVKLVPLAEQIRKIRYNVEYINKEINDLTSRIEV